MRSSHNRNAQPTFVSAHAHPSGLSKFLPDHLNTVSLVPFVVPRSLVIRHSDGKCRPLILPKTAEKQGLFLSFSKMSWGCGYRQRPGGKASLSVEQPRLFCLAILIEPCSIGGMRAMSNIPGYLTAQEVADLLKVDRSQVSRYCTEKDEEHRLPSIWVGNARMIKASDLRKFKPRPKGNPNFQKAS